MDKPKQNQKKPDDKPAELTYRATIGNFPISLAVANDHDAYKFGAASKEAGELIKQFEGHEIHRADAAIACGKIERIFSGYDMTITKMCTVVRNETH